MKSGVLLLLLGSAGLLLAVVGFPAFLFWHVGSLGLSEEGVLNEAEKQFLAPGEVVVELEEAGDYLLWFHYQVRYQGTEYDFPPEVPPELEVEVIEEEPGAVAVWVPFGDEMDFTVEVGDLARKNVGVIETEAPGTYRLRVSGDFEPRVFSIATSPLDDLFGGIGTLFIVAILMGLTSVGVLIFGIVLMVRGGR